MMYASTNTRNVRLENYRLHFRRVPRRIRIDTTAITIRPNKRKKKKEKEVKQTDPKEP